MKKIINTQKAPAPIGPYNQAVMAGNTLYISGQIGIDPKTGEVVPEGIEAETRQVLLNLKEVLHAAGMDFADVVKTTIYLTDFSDFAAVNKIYASCFMEDTAPARETVEVSQLPKSVKVEISMIAVK